VYGASQLYSNHSKLRRVQVSLAATVHDPGGYLVPGIERTGVPIRSLFPVVAVNATNVTDGRLLDGLSRHWGAEVQTHEPGNVSGRARRDAVRAALASECDRVLYCDLDHVIRWVESSPGEVRAITTHSLGHDLLIVGRTQSAFARSPARLRETESIVNHVYALITGRVADAMFAVRVLSRPAARAVVEGCQEDTIANDVEWPLFAERVGLSVWYVAAEGLDYRINPDFDKASDSRDLDPVAWIDRAEIGLQHLRTMRQFVDARS